MYVFPSGALLHVEVYVSLAQGRLKWVRVRWPWRIPLLHPQVCHPDVERRKDTRQRQLMCV